MSTLYPAQVDTVITLPSAVDKATPVEAVVVNRLRDAIIAIESELGPKPSGIYGTVRNRLDVLENLIVNGGGGGPTPPPIVFAGDLAGVATHQVVIGIFNRPIDQSVIPSVGQFLGWNGSHWLPQTAFSAGGDLSGTNINQVVVGLNGFPVSSTPPLNGQFLSWDGASWIPTTIGTIYSTTLTGVPYLEFGETLANPLFIATYDLTPVTATIQDSIGSGIQNVFVSPAPPSIPPNVFSYQPFAPNVQQEYVYTAPTSITFTLTSTHGTFPHIATVTSTSTATWTQRLYYGTDFPGGNTASFIKSLKNNPLEIFSSYSFTVNAEPGQSIYFAYRTAYGVADFWANGFEGGFTLVSTTIPVTNSHGFIENYTLYQSDSIDLGVTEIEVFLPSTTNLISLDVFNPGVNSFVPNTITLGGPPVYLEIGQALIDPIFTVNYTFPPISATIQDNQGNPAQNIFTAAIPSVLPNIFVYSQSYIYNNYPPIPHSVSFTLTSEDGLTATKNTIITSTWVQRLYYGVASPGGSTASFIQSLSNNPLTAASGFSFTVNAGVGQSIYFAYRTGYGVADFWIDGFEGGFNLVSTAISVTNEYGFTENYTLYQSAQVGLGITEIYVIFPTTTNIVSLDVFNPSSNNGNLFGDVTGPTDINTVVKIRNIPVSASTPTEQEALVLKNGTYEPAGVIKVFNVKSHGAIGDGVADDTTAIQNCINAAYSALVNNTFVPDTTFSTITVWFPSGIYKISSELEANVYICLKGDRNSSIVQSNSNANVIRLAGQRNDIDNLCLSGGKSQVVYYGPAPALGGALGTPTAESQNQISNCVLFGGTGPMIYLDTTLVANGGSYAPGRLESSSSFRITNCNIYANGSIWFGSADGVFFDNNYAIIDWTAPVMGSLDNITYNYPLAAFTSGDHLSISNFVGVPNNLSNNPAYIEGNSIIKCLDVRFGGESTLVACRIRHATAPYFNGMKLHDVWTFAEIHIDDCEVTCSGSRNWLEVYDSFPRVVKMTQGVGSSISPSISASLVGTNGIWVDSNTVTKASMSDADTKSLMIIYDDGVFYDTAFRIRYGNDPSVLSGPNALDLKPLLRRFINGYFPPIDSSIRRDNLFLPTLIDPFGNGIVMTHGGNCPGGGTDTTSGYSITIAAPSANGQNIQDATSTTWGSGVPAGEYTFSVAIKADYGGQFTIGYEPAGGGFPEVMFYDFQLAAEWERIGFTFWHDGTTVKNFYFQTFNMPSGGHFMYGLPAIQRGIEIAAYLYPVDSASAPTTNVTNESIVYGKYYGTAAPTGGTYIVGDTVINLTPTPTTPDYWTCTTSGSPGTWTPQYFLTSLTTGITLAGNVTGPTGSNTVVSITGCPVLFTDTTGVVLGKTTSSDIGVRIAPLIGQETLYAGVWVGASALAPTGGNYLMALSNTSSFIGNGSDTLNINNAFTNIIGNITLNSPSIQWTSVVVNPIINQASTSTTSGATLSIGAQSATGATHNGGNLILAGGVSGSATQGTVSLQSANTTTLVADPTGVVLGQTTASFSGTRIAPLNGSETLYSSIWTGANALSPSSSNYTMALSPISCFWQGAASLALSFSSTFFNSSNTGNTYVTINAGPTASLTFSNLATSPIINQSDKTTNGGTGTTLTIQAQNETGTTSTGGALNLTSGTGTTSAGALNLQVGGTTAFQVNSLAGGYGGIFAGGASPTSQNFLFLVDPSGTNSYLGSSGEVHIQINGSDTAQFTSTSIISLVSTINFTGGTGDFQSNGTTIAEINANKLWAKKGWRQNVTSVSSSPYTVLATDNIIAANSTSIPLTINLPSSPGVGDTYQCKDIKGTSATNSITLDSGSGNTIDNAQTFVINTNYGSLTVVCIATSPNQWSII